jgi:hypothetical protein
VIFKVTQPEEEYGEPGVSNHAVPECMLIIADSLDECERMLKELFDQEVETTIKGTNLFRTQIGVRQIDVEKEPYWTQWPDFTITEMKGPILEIQSGQYAQSRSDVVEYKKRRVEECF